MATTRKGTAQPFKKGPRTLGAALSAATKGVGATANPQDPARELAKNAGGRVTVPGQIKTLQRQKTAQKLQDALKRRTGAVPMPSSGGATGKVGAPDPEGGRRVVDDGAGVRPRATKPSKPASVSASLAGPPQKTYVSKGEINQSGNARAGEDFATFTVAGKPGEYHEYVENGKRRVVRVGGGRSRGKSAPRKGARSLGSALNG